MKTQEPEFVATFKTSCQISPDDWKVYHPSLKVTRNTTIAEIEAFYRKHNATGNIHITINGMENVPDLTTPQS